MEENVNLFHELYNGHYMDRSMNMDQNHKFLYTMLYLHDILRKKRLAGVSGKGQSNNSYCTRPYYKTFSP